MKSPILGGHTVARSTNLADNQCYNLFPSVVETKDGRDVAAFYMCPGLDLLVTAGSGPIRALRNVQGTLYAVSGNTVYTVNNSWGASSIGTIGTSSGPVSIIDNGPLHQVAIFDGNAGYLSTSGGALSSLTLPFSGPTQATYQDTFGLVYQASSNTWWQSNVGDLSTWTSLDFSTADGSSDNIVSIISIHREVWILKTNHTEVWTDQGSAGFAFGRLEGVSLQHGCAAEWSVTIVGEDLVWLSQNEAGAGRVVAARGYQIETVSTAAMETEIATYSTISDAIGYAYEQEGEAFYVLTFPTAGVTWCYTVRAKLWHKRASFSGGNWGRHWGNCYAYFNGRCVVGDYQSGKLYGFNLDNHLDNGTARKWLRSWRALERPSMKPVRFNRLDIFMETGAQVANGFDPQLMLRWSDDGGHNYSNFITQSAGISAGQGGQTAKKIRFNRLGATTYSRGMDRIFELSSADAFKVAIFGADLG